jgi:hypothetical protein
MLVAMDPRGEMRAGDADRQAVAEKLRWALDEGRLDLGEYDERLQKAYAAKTYADLDGLLTDLPGIVPPSRAQLAPLADGTLAPTAAGLPEQGNLTMRWLAHTWDGYFPTVGIVVAIWAVICLMSREWIYFWPGWVAGPWGAVLLVVTLTGLSSGEPRKWAAKKERERQEKDAKKDEEPDDGA